MPRRLATPKTPEQLKAEKKARRIARNERKKLARLNGAEASRQRKAKMEQEGKTEELEISQKDKNNYRKIQLVRDCAYGTKKEKSAAECELRRLGYSDDTIQKLIKKYNKTGISVTENL
jgi:hypothetical protein|nr:MAG TPA: hypothetical protein [Caudoviricetes sp.]DAX61724.1 MAG TPA: hypothetical protein [Caudoviricetes sp.]